MLIHTIVLLAQTQKTSPKSSGAAMLIGLGLMIAVFYFVLIRGNRRQQKERSSMLDNLSKNDKVMTIGGIMGTVVQVREHEVVIKVDESSNTKMTFMKKAIQQVIKEGDLPSLDKR